KAQILTIPGEALPNIGFYLKRKMRGEHHLLFGLTNDAFGYILTRVDFNSFPRYEYVSQTSLGEQTGEIMIEKALELVRIFPPPARAPARPRSCRCCLRRRRPRRPRRRPPRPRPRSRRPRRPRRRPCRHPCRRPSSCLQ